MEDPHNYFPGKYECGTIAEGVWLAGKVEAVMYDSAPSEGMVLEIIKRDDDGSMPRSIRKENRWLTHFQSLNDYDVGTSVGEYLFCLFYLDAQRKTRWQLRPLLEWKGHAQYAEYFAKLKNLKSGSRITVPRAKEAAAPSSRSQPQTSRSTRGISNASCYVNDIQCTLCKYVRRQQASDRQVSLQVGHGRPMFE
jgi:hypothetical protein